METTKSATSPVSVSRTLGNAQGELILRITGNSARPETVSVRSSKCTIGSADACTIRLNNADVQPVHCIILRGTSETVVRRWADNVWLNGKQFDDASLAAGDILSLANMQIEVVSDDRSDDVGALQRSVAAAESKVAELSQHSQVLNERIRHLESAGSSSLSDIAQNELLVRLARLQDDKQELERRIAAQSVRHLDERRQWTCDLERFQAQIAQLQDGQNAVEQLEAAQRTVADLRQELDELQSQLAQQQADFEAEKTRWQEAAAEHTDAENHEAAELRERIAALESKQAEFEQAKRDFEASQQTAQQELEQRFQELDTRRQDFESLSATSLYDELEAVPESGTADEDAFPSRLIAETGPWQGELGQGELGQGEMADEPAAAELANHETGEVVPAEEHFSATNEEAGADCSSQEQDSWEFEDDLGTTTNLEELGSFNNEYADAEYDEFQDEEFVDEGESESESESEYEAEAEYEPVEAVDADANDDYARSDLHEEIGHLIEEETTADDFMSYASQVAEEVSDQVIDQRPELEQPTEPEEWQESAEDAVAPEVDYEPTAQHDDDIQAEAFEPSRDGADASCDDGEAFTEFEEPVAELEEAVAAERIVDQEAAAAPSQDRSNANIEAMTEDWAEVRTAADREADNEANGESYDSPFESPRVELEEFAAAQEPVEPLADEVAASVAEDSTEHDPIEDDMLARLQAMVEQKDQVEADDASQADEPAAPAIDAESMLAELQAFDAEHPAGPYSNEFAAETTAYEKVQEALLSAAAASELEHDTPTAPEEVTYESVVREEPGQLQTASLLSQFGVADDVEEDLAVPAPEFEPVAAAPQPNSELTAATADADSIEDYMQQLLQRNSSDGDSAAFATVNTAPAAAVVAAATAPKKRPRTPSRATVPLDSLAKMRELANESNRSAIMQHAASSFRANVFSNLCFCGIAALASAIFFVLSRGASYFWLLPSLGSAGASVFFGYKAIMGGTRSALSGVSRRSISKSKAKATAAAAGLATSLEDDFTQPDPLQQQPFPEPDGLQSAAFNDPLAEAQPGYEQATFDQQPQMNPATTELAQPYAQQPQLDQEPANHPFGQAPIDPHAVDQTQVYPAAAYPTAEQPQPAYQEPQTQYQDPQYQDPAEPYQGQQFPPQQYHDSQFQGPQLQNPQVQDPGQQLQWQQFQEQHDQNPQFQDPAAQASESLSPQVPGSPPPEYVAFPTPQYPGQTPTGLPEAPLNDPNTDGSPQQPGTPQFMDPTMNQPPYPDGVDPTQQYPQPG